MAWSREIKRCWALFDAIGARSPRWLEINKRDAPQAARLVQEDVFKNGVKVAQVASARRESEGYIIWMASTGWPFHAASPLQISSYLRDRRHQSRSAPGRALRGLIWLEKVTDLVLHSKNPTCVSQTKHDVSTGKPSAPVAARTPTFEILGKFEDMVWTAPTPPLRIYAGFNTMLAWAVVRGHDAQHTHSLTLTKDAIVGESYDTKNNKSSAVMQPSALECEDRIGAVNLSAFSLNMIFQEKTMWSQHATHLSQRSPPGWHLLPISKPLFAFFSNVVACRPRRPCPTRFMAGNIYCQPPRDSCGNQMMRRTNFGPHRLPWLCATMPRHAPRSCS